MGPIVGSAIACAALFVVGVGFGSSVSSAMAGIFELGAIASGVVFVGLIDGK